MTLVLTPEQQAMVTKYYRLIDDDPAVAFFVNYADKPYVEASKIVRVLRDEARALGVDDNTNIHAEVQPGCTFKRDIPQMGPTYEDFQYLQSWNFPDPPTEHELVSWIPKPLAESKKKNVSEQMEVIVKFKTKVGLPAWYEVSFGSLNHVGGMAFVHFNAMGKNPFNGLVVRTDTRHAADDYLFELDWGWDDNGRRCLFCDDWNLGSVRLSRLATFVVGVVKAVEH